MQNMKKLFALLLCACMLLGVLAGCTQQQAPAETPAPAPGETAQPGTDSGPSGTGSASAQGYAGKVTVSVTVENGSVTAVQAEGAEETPALGGRALTMLPEAMVQANAVDVDTMTGATATSNAVLLAAKAAYAQAVGEAIEVKMAPGAYTAEAYGFAMAEPLSVTVTVSETAIETIEVDMDNGETKPILQSVVDLMVPRMVEHQSISIDTITGATGSSNGVRSAVTLALEDALEKGGSQPSAIAAFLNEKPMKTGEPQTIDVDVLVVGMGGSGTAAAVSAAETLHELDPANVNILAIDKAGKYGGTAANTQEMMAINPPRFMEEHNGGKAYVDVKTFREAWLKHTEGDEKTEMVDFMLENSGKMLDWIVYEHNYDMSEPQTGFTESDTYVIKYQYMPNNTAGNKDVIGTYFDGMYKDYTALGGKYMLETEAYELVYDAASNTVTGVKARDVDGVEYLINAKSIILASGGFGANQEMQEKYLSNEYWPLKGKWNLFGMKQNDGKMIESAINIGAGTYNIGMSPMVHMAGPPVFISGFEKHYPEGGIAFFTNRQAVWSAGDLALALTTAQNMLFVGQDGKRFTNEADMFIWWKAGPGYYSILSEKEILDIRDNGLKQGTFGASVVYVGHQTGIPTGVPLPETEAVMQAGMDAGYIFKADTLEDLAARIGLDGATLANTVAEYNGYCEAGVDEAFGKAADFLDPISNEGPYYAVYGESYPFSTCGGLDINLNFNVLQADHETPINGLYAVGTDSMGVLFTEKRDYVTFGGAAQGWAYTSGMFCGQYAAKDAAGKQ